MTSMEGLLGLPLPTSEVWDLAPAANDTFAAATNDTLDLHGDEDINQFYFYEVSGILSSPSDHSLKIWSYTLVRIEAIYSFW
jgi:hypothetical protein